MYFAYRAEAILHNEDRFSVSVEAAKLEGYDPSAIEEAVKFERLHSHRMEIEMCLFDATKGDYRQIKTRLQLIGEEKYMKILY